MNIPLNIDWQQILLHLFNFVLLAGGLYLLLYRPVKDFMKKREDHYAQMAQEAEKDRQEARQMVQDYKEKLADIDQEFAGRNRRYYRLTPSGAETLAKLRTEWVEYRQAVDAMLLNEGDAQ